MRNRLSAVWLVVFAAAMLLLAGPAHAQFTGNIEGVVTDPSGGTVASAKVTLVNVATQITATTSADASGYYRFLSLAPGTYKVRVEEPVCPDGNNVALEYNQTLNVPIQLRLARRRKRSPSPVKLRC